MCTRTIAITAGAYGPGRANIQHHVRPSFAYICTTSVPAPTQPRLPQSQTAQQVLHLSRGITYAHNERNKYRISVWMLQ